MTVTAMIKGLLIGIAFVAMQFLVFAQDSMERIVAVVGNEIILKSDVDGQVELYGQRFPGADKTDPKLRDAVLDQLINERLIMAAASEDTTIVISDEEISQRMDYQIATLIQQVGSEKRIEDIYGMSISKIKKDFRDQIRLQLLAERIRAKRFGSVKVSRADVEAFYAKYKDSIPALPARVDLYHIVRYVTPSAEQSKEAQQLALRICDSLAKGGSFADFARRYSGDPGSAANGGDLGFVERGKFVPAFEASAFALEAGQTSAPVETPFGWHIIQLIDKSATAINCRHILIRVSLNEEDREHVRKELQDVRQRVLNGEDFETLARELTDEKETKGFGGAMGQFEFERLPEDMRTVVKELKDGEVSSPLPYVADPTKPGFHIIYRKALTPEHKATLESDYKMIEQMALLEKKTRIEQEWVAELRGRLYWEKR